MIVNPVYWRYDIFSIIGKVHVTNKITSKIILKIWMPVNVIKICKKNAFKKYLNIKYAKYTIANRVEIYKIVL